MHFRSEIRTQLSEHLAAPTGPRVPSPRRRAVPGCRLCSILSSEAADSPPSPLLFGSCKKVTGAPPVAPDKHVRIKLHNSTQESVPRPRGLAQSTCRGLEGCCEEERSGRLSRPTRRILLELGKYQGPSKDENPVSENTQMCLKVSVAPWPVWLSGQGEPRVRCVLALVKQEATS